MRGVGNLKKIIDFITDILKCFAVALGIFLIILSISWAICFIMYRGDTLALLNAVKRGSYFIGIMGLFLSSGFFLQRNATRPLVYSEQWKSYFRFLNLGFVIMFVGFFLCSIGMIVQNFAEKMGGL